MTTSYNRFYLLLLAVCWLCPLVLDASGSWMDSPNIILINVDDLGYMDTELYGNTDFQTPNLRRLAAMGLTFRNGYAASANCAPSRACLFSGQYTPRHGMYTVGSSERGKSKDRKIIPTPNSTVLADSVLTVAGALKRAGYRTIHIGKWHIGEDPKTYGFDVNIGGTHQGHPKSYFSPYGNPTLPDGAEGEYLTDRIMQEAIGQITQQRDPATPFFMNLATFAVHTPLQGKPELVQKYRRKGFNDKLANYAAMVENLDINIGLLLEALGEMGLMERTLLVFTSDNGGICALHSQHPLRAGKGSYYEGGTKVPLVFVWKGTIAPGSECGVPATNVDFFPTFLAVAGVNTPPAGKLLDGTDLTPVLYGANALPVGRTLYWHFPVYLQKYSGKDDDARDTLFRTRPGSTLLEGQWKLHHYFEDDEFELYNLANDPGERHNLVNEEERMAKRLIRKLRHWQEQTHAPIPHTPNPDYRQID